VDRSPDLSDSGGVFVPDSAEASLNIAACKRSVAAGRRFNSIVQSSGST
jgi:hypothetical protein